MGKGIGCAGQAPDMLETDMLLEVMRDQFPERADEYLTDAGKEEAKVRGKQVAQHLKDIELFDDTISPSELYIRATDVPRTKATAKSFMQGFLEEFSQSTSIKKHPHIPGRPDSSKEFSIHVMPQSGIRRIGGDGDFLLESSNTRWEETKKEPAKRFPYPLPEDETDDGEYIDDEPEETDKPLDPLSKLNADIEKFKKETRFQGNIEDLSDSLKRSRHSGTPFKSDLSESQQVYAIELGESKQLLEYNSSTSKMCTKAHDLFLHIKDLFNSVPPPVSKYRLYVTHNTNIMAALNMLDISFTEHPPYFATLRFELLHSEQEFFVRTSYDCKTFITCPAGSYLGNPSYCSINAFYAFIFNRLLQCKPTGPIAVRTL